ncbi:hypothetical protein DM860_004012 [Cuscuta australis]|uniref:Nuclear transcription factor Y subunit n=1 Tax=Cuscuta australis TaxID=267555 RepID=A0A328CWV3_9ASTE|nr:hypothetical protein DM860_004012 [Cuscuta australis]
MEHLSLQLQGHTSPSAQSSPFQSQQKEVTAAPKITSKDQTCISSESESHGKHLSAQINPMFLVGNPDLSLNPSHGEMNQSMIHSPYNYSDPYYSGLFAAYGPQPFPQMFGITSTRVPLDLADDGPIYVNAKQYHGILRRRQIRAKLEAQNKLVKNRRPYLHESRHLHAVKRVRGSGGRFLSTKNLQDSLSTNCISATGSLQHIATSSAGPHSMIPHGSGLHANVVLFQQQQRGKQYYSPVVR